MFAELLLPIALAAPAAETIGAAIAAERAAPAPAMEAVKGEWATGTGLLDKAASAHGAHGDAGHGDAGHDSHGHGGHGGAHDSPWVMLGPLVVLAVMSFVAGWPLEHGFAEFLGRVLPAAERHEGGGAILAEAIAVALALGGVAFGWLVYQRGAIDPDRMVKWLDPAQLYTCPCHDAAFDINGAVVAGPPPRPLDAYENKVEDGTLYIHYQES